MTTETINTVTDIAPKMGANNDLEVSIEDFTNDQFADAKLDAETLKRIADTPIDTALDAPESNAPIYDSAPAPSVTPMSSEEAKTQTQMLMKGRDMLQQHALALLAKEPERTKEFALSSTEFDWLCEVYAEYVGVLGKIPSWVNILIAEAVIMGPKIAKVFNYRKLKNENEALKAELRTYKKKEAQAAKSKVVPLRSDSKKSWTVDENGYFEYGVNGTYIKKDDRTEKPQLTAENYDKLCEHNGTERIDKIFKIEK